MSTYFRKNFNISVDQNDISSYLREIQKFPILTHDNEIKLANKWIKSIQDKVYDYGSFNIKSSD